MVAGYAMKQWPIHYSKATPLARPSPEPIVSIPRSALRRPLYLDPFPRRICPSCRTALPLSRLLAKPRINGQSTTPGPCPSNRAHPALAPKYLRETLLHGANTRARKHAQTYAQVGQHLVWDPARLHMDTLGCTHARTVHLTLCVMVCARDNLVTP